MAVSSYASLLVLGGVPLTSEDAVLSSAPATDALPAAYKCKTCETPLMSEDSLARQCTRAGHVRTPDVVREEFSRAHCVRTGQR